MADRGTFPNNATFIANAAMLTSLVVGDTVTIAGTVYAWDGTGWEAPWPRDAAAPLANEDGSFSFAGPVVAPNSISSFLPGQTEGVPDTAALVVNAGTSQVLALPTGTAFRLDWAGFGPFAFRFGSSSAVAVATDFPGVVGLPQYFEKPAGATHIAVYGIGGGTLVVSGGSRP